MVYSLLEKSFLKNSTPNKTTHMTLKTSRAIEISDTCTLQEHLFPAGTLHQENLSHFGGFEISKVQIP